MDLSANLRAIVSQRLVRREDGKGRAAAIEILLNTPTIAEKIFTGHFNEIKDIMAARASWACARSTWRCSTSTSSARSASRRPSATPIPPTSCA